MTTHGNIFYIKWCQNIFKLHVTCNMFNSVQQGITSN